MSEMKLVRVDGTEIRTDNELRIGKRIHGHGRVTLELETRPRKEMCKGCRDDFYNGEGAEECWMFKKAIVCNKVGYSTMNVGNGPDTIMKDTLNCWHAVSR